jgi:hypothetical protein
MKQPNFWRAIALVALAAILPLALVVACGAPSTQSEPAGPVRLASTPNITNFTGLYVDNSVEAGDDLIAGDDLTVADDATVTDNLTISGDLAVTGTSTLTGGLAGGTLSLSGALDVGGNADEVQLTVTDYTTPTHNAMAITDSAATGVISFTTAPLTGADFSFIEIVDTLPVLGSSDDAVGLHIDLTGADHTGGTTTGIDLDLASPDGQNTEIALDISNPFWDMGIKGVEDQEHLMLPSVNSKTITVSSDGAQWSIGASELWFIHALYCHITTNFDCSGDDCVMQFGDGNDPNGLLDLVDGELQTADTEGTGAPAGWQGFMSTDTIGAYLTNGLGFVYSGSETIDVLIEDSSDHSNPSAGAATCYLVYTRVQ